MEAAHTNHYGAYPHVYNIYSAHSSTPTLRPPQRQIRPPQNKDHLFNYYPPMLYCFRIRTTSGLKPFWPLAVGSLNFGVSMPDALALEISTQHNMHKTNGFSQKGIYGKRIEMGTPRTCQKWESFTRRSQVAIIIGRVHFQVGFCCIWQTWIALFTQVDTILYTCFADTVVPLKYNHSLNCREVVLLPRLSNIDNAGVVTLGGGLNADVVLALRWSLLEVPPPITQVYTSHV